MTLLKLGRGGGLERFANRQGMKLEFGFSPCPNDTFMFWAWAHERVASQITLMPRMADIQELNKMALADAPLALTKVSASTYLEPKVRERYRLLNVGAALGRGCGPLMVSKTPWALGDSELPRVAIPGRNTTACRLAQAALGGQVKEWVELRYDDIMPAVLDGRVDAGVVIHESRFTYAGLGLHLAFDFGTWWEKLTGLPLPLGVMVARRDLDDAVVAEAERTLAASLARAWKLFEQPADPENRELWEYLRHHAIELDDTTMAAHIDLYVNEYSADLGAEGHAALERFSSLDG